MFFLKLQEYKPLLIIDPLVVVCKSNWFSTICIVN